MAWKKVYYESRSFDIESREWKSNKIPAFYEVPDYSYIIGTVSVIIPALTMFFLIFR